MRKYLFLFIVFLIPTLISSCSKEENGNNQEETTITSLLLKNQTVSTEYLQDSNGKFDIYLPSDWATTKETYPVLYLFHGMYGNNNDWSSNGVVAMTDDAIKAGTVDRFIIVMPNAYNSFYVDGYDGLNDFESFFFKDLVPYIEKTYPVKTGKKNTAIAGLSMGGFGASYYAFMYPEKYCFCYSMSGAVEGVGSVLTPSLKTIFETKGYNSSNFSSLPDYYMDCGSSDIIVLTSNERMEQYLKSISFPHTYRENEGAHDWTFWKSAYKRLLPDLGKYFKQ